MRIFGPTHDGALTVDLFAPASHAHPMFDRSTLFKFLESQMPAALEMLRQMVNQNSFTANREGVNRVAALTTESFARLGFSAERVPSMNPAWGDHLILTRPGSSGKGIGMISHLDTVFPPEEEARNNFRWSVEGDRIFGPGTHDIKGGTVMMWLVLSALRALAPETFEALAWTLLWNSSEECFSPDFGEVCKQRMKVGTMAALVFEAEGRAGETPLLVLARKGRCAWRVTVNGRGAHAGGRHEYGANAIVQLGRTLERVAALTDYSRKITFNAGTVRGGTVLNRVPHEAEAEGEFRAFTPEIYEQGKRALLALAGAGEVRSAADGYPCRIQVDILTESRPWPRNAATDALFELWRNAAAEIGLKIMSEERGGLSDGNPLWDFVPTLDGLGPWGENDHCSERSQDGKKLPEFVEISSFVPKAALNMVAIQKLAQAGT